jgi:hypothetical protein
MQDAQLPHFASMTDRCHGSRLDDLASLVDRVSTPLLATSNRSSRLLLSSSYLGRWTLRVSVLEPELSRHDDRAFEILPPDLASSFAFVVFTAVDVGVFSVVAVASCALGLVLVLGIFAVSLRHGDRFALRFS